jgi:phosphoribosyl-ATP pyrophosphohydrolase
MDEKMTEPIIAQLMSLIRDRYENRPDGSYTTALFDAGVEEIGGKLCEEALELAAAIDSEETDAVVHEAADLVYHLLVAIAFCEVDFTQVEAELQRRFGISGLEEKRSR